MHVYKLHIAVILNNGAIEKPVVQVYAITRQHESDECTRTCDTVNTRTQVSFSSRSGCRVAQLKTVHHKKYISIRYERFTTTKNWRTRSHIHVLHCLLIDDKNTSMSTTTKTHACVVTDGGIDKLIRHVADIKRIAEPPANRWRSWCSITAIIYANKHQPLGEAKRLNENNSHAQTDWRQIR
jgi:hypothetical protein